MPSEILENFGGGRECGCRGTLNRPYDRAKWTHHELLHECDKQTCKILKLNAEIQMLRRPWWNKFLHKLRRADGKRQH